MANNMLLGNEDENTVELDSTAENTLDTARDVAQDAVAQKTETKVPEIQTERPSDTKTKPSFTDDEMLGNLRSGIEYDQADLDTMSESDYARYQKLANDYYAQNPTPKMKADHQRSRLELADRLQKMAQFTADHTDGDKDYADINAEANKEVDFFKGNTSLFVNMSDEKAALLQADIEKKYDAATKRLGHAEHMWNQLKLGYLSCGNMIYQGMKATIPGSLDSEEDADLIRGTMQTQKDLEIENPQKVGGFENIRSAGDVIDYFSDTVVQNVPRALASIGMSVAGATALPVSPVAGAIAFGTLGTMWMNTGEAIQDIIDEKRSGDDDIRNSRGYALLQGLAYSVLDGAFGVSMWGAKLWSGMLKKLGKDAVKDAAKGAGVEWAKDTVKNATLKGVGKDLLLHGVVGEGVQEMAQSQIAGRGVRALQTGSLFRLKDDGTYETPNEAYWEAANEFVGGAVSGLTFGLLGGGVSHIDARRTVDSHVNNIMSVLKNDPAFNDMNDYAKLLVSKHLENDGYLSTTNLFDQKYMKALEKCNADIDAEIKRLSELPGEKNVAQRVSGQSARIYLDIFNSQYDLADIGGVIVNRDMKTGRWRCSDGADYRPNIDIGGMRENYQETTVKTNDKDGNAVERPVRLFTNPVDGSKITVGQVLDSDGNPTGQYIFDNDKTMKMPVYGDKEIVCDSIDAAIEKACDLDVYNQWRKNKMKAKAEMANTVFDHLYGKRGFKLNLVDRPSEGDDANASTIASVNAQTRTVNLSLDKINNLGKLYVTLMHERTHADIVDFLLKSDKWVRKVGMMDEFDWAEFEKDRKALFEKVKDEFGVSAEDMSSEYRTSKSKLGRDGEYSNTTMDWGRSAGRAGEEMAVERNSIRGIVRESRRANRGVAGAVSDKVYGLALNLLNKVKTTPGSKLDLVRQTIAQKMALDMGVDPMAIMNGIDDNVSEELAKIFDTGYMGVETPAFSRDKAKTPETEGSVSPTKYGATSPIVNPSKDEMTVGTMNTTEDDGPMNPTSGKKLKPAMKNGEGASFADGSYIRRADGKTFIRKGDAWNSVDTNETVDDETATRGGYNDFAKPANEADKTTAQDTPGSSVAETTDASVATPKTNVAQSSGDGAAATTEVKTEKPKAGKKSGKTKDASKKPVAVENAEVKEDGASDAQKAPEAVPASPIANDEKSVAPQNTEEKSETGKDEIKPSQEIETTVDKPTKDDNTSEAPEKPEKAEITEKVEPVEKTSRKSDKKSDKNTDAVKEVPKAASAKMSPKLKKSILGALMLTRIAPDVEERWMNLDALPAGTVIGIGDEKFKKAAVGDPNVDRMWNVVGKGRKKTGQMLLAKRGSYTLVSVPEVKNGHVSVKDDNVSLNTPAESFGSNVEEVSESLRKMGIDEDKLASISATLLGTKKPESEKDTKPKDDVEDTPIRISEDEMRLNKIDAEIDEAVDAALGFVNDEQRKSIKTLARQHGNVTDISQVKGADGYVIVEFDGHDACLAPDGRELTDDETDDLLSKREGLTEGSGPASSLGSAIIRCSSILAKTQQSRGHLVLGGFSDDTAKNVGLSGNALLARASNFLDMSALNAIWMRWSDPENGRLTKWLADKDLSAADVKDFKDAAYRALSGAVLEGSRLAEAKRNYEAIVATLTEDEKKAMRDEYPASLGRIDDNPLGTKITEDGLFAKIVSEIYSAIEQREYATNEKARMEKLSDESEKTREKKALEFKRAVRKEALKTGRSVEDLMRERASWSLMRVPEEYRAPTRRKDEDTKDFNKRYLDQEKWLCRKCLGNGTSYDVDARKEVSSRINDIINGNVASKLNFLGLGNDSIADVFEETYGIVEQEWENRDPFWNGDWSVGQNLRTHVLAILNRKVRQEMDKYAKNPANVSYDDLVEKSGNAAEFAAMNERFDEKFDTEQDVGLPGEISSFKDPAANVFGEFDDSVDEDEMRKAEGYFENVKKAVDYILDGPYLSHGQKNILRSLMNEWQNRVNEAKLSLEDARRKSSHATTVKSLEEKVRNAYRLKFDNASIDFFAASDLGMKPLVYRAKLARLLEDIETAIAGSEVSKRDRSGKLSKRDKAYLHELSRGLFGEKDVSIGFDRHPVIDNSVQTLFYNGTDLMACMRQNKDTLMAWCCRLASSGMTDTQIENEIKNGNAKDLDNRLGAKGVDTILDHAYTDYGWIDTRIKDEKKSLLKLVKKVMLLNRGGQMFDEQLAFVNRWMKDNGVKASEYGIQRSVLHNMFNVSTVHVTSAEERKAYTEKRNAEIQADHDVVADIYDENPEFSEEDVVNTLKKRGLSEKRVKQMLDRHVSVELKNYESRRKEHFNRQKEYEKEFGKAKLYKAEPESEKTDAEKIKALPVDEKRKILKEKLSGTGDQYVSDSAAIAFAINELGMSQLLANVIVRGERPVVTEFTAEEMSDRNTKIDDEHGAMRRLNEEELVKFRENHKAEREKFEKEKEERTKLSDESEKRMKAKADRMQKIISRVGMADAKNELRKVIASEKANSPFYGDEKISKKVNDIIDAWIEVYGKAQKSAKENDTRRKSDVSVDKQRGGFGLNENDILYGDGLLRSYTHHTKDDRNRDMRGSFAAALGLRRDFSDGTVVSPKVVRKVFNAFRPDSAQKILFDRFMPFAEELGVSFRLFGKDSGQAGDELAGRVNYYVDVKYDVPTVILHELIHAATAYAVSAYNNESPTTRVGVTPELSRAIDKVNRLYNANKGWIKDEYGATNLKEFMAEMSNPSMRDALARRNLWQQIVDFFVDMFNAISGRERVVRGSEIYDNVVKAMDDVLTNGNKKTFDEFRDAADNDPYFDKNNLIRELDRAADGMYSKLEQIKLSNGEKVMGFRIQEKMREDINRSGTARFKSDVPLSEQKGRFRSVDDPNAFFGSKAGREAKGLHDNIAHVPKSDIITNREAEALLANKAKFAKVVKKGENFEPINDIEARALTLAISRNLASGLHDRLDAQGHAKNDAEVDAYVRALSRGLSKAGRALRMAKVGVDLRVRDSVVYMAEQLRAQLEREDEKRYGIVGAQESEIVKERDAKIASLTVRLSEMEKEMAKWHDIAEKNQRIIDEKNAAADDEVLARAREEGRRIGREEGRREESEAERKRRLSELDNVVSTYGANKDRAENGVAFANVLGDLFGGSTRRFAGNPSSAKLDDRMRTAFNGVIDMFDGDVEKARKYLSDKYEGFASVMEPSFNRFVSEIDKTAKTAGLAPEAKHNKRKKVVREKAVQDEKKSPIRNRRKIEDKLINDLADADILARSATDDETALREVGEAARILAKLLLIKNPDMSKELFVETIREHMSSLVEDGSFDDHAVMDAFLGRGDFKPISRREAQLKLEDMLKAKKLLEDAGDDPAKIAEVIRTLGFKDTSDAAILQELDYRIGKILNKKLDVLESRMNESDASNEELRGQIKTLVEALRDIRSGTKTVKELMARYVELAEGMKDYRRQRSVLDRINSRIAMYERKIANNDFEPAPKRENPDTENEVGAIQHAMRRLERARERFNNERKMWKIRKEPFFNRHLSSMLEILGEIKALAGSMDLSSVLRQGGQLSWAHPILASKNIVKTLRILSSEEKCNEAFDSIWNRPNARYYQKAGIEFTDWGMNASNSEELFLLNQYRKITRAKYPRIFVECSERAFSMFLNLMRADAFDAMVANSPARTASAFSDKDLKTIGNYINIASQRGVIDKSGSLGKALKAANAVLWSPRNLISRVQFIANTATLLLPGFKSYGTTDWAMRKMLAKETARYFAGVASAIFFTKLMADLFRSDDEPEEDIVTDPRSSDFLCVKVGNTHLDFLSGLKQFVTFTARMVDGRSSNARGREMTVNRAEIIGKFMRSKFSPASSIIYDIVTRESYDKQDIVFGSPFMSTKDEIGVARYAFGQVMPLSLGDIKDQFSENGPMRGIVTSIFAMLGAGANTYDPYTYKQLKGDYNYFRRLYRDANTEAERKEILENYPMLRNAGAIEAQIKHINSINKNISDLEKVGGNADNSRDMLERAQKQAINLMMGARHPMDVM